MTMFSLNLTLTLQKKSEQICEDLKKAKYKIINLGAREINKSPLPPFSTSSLQQEANTKLGFSVKQTMFIAQKLYEGIKLGDKK